MMKRFFFCFLATLALGPAPALAQSDPDWARYTGARFATSVEYPAALFPDSSEPDNGDGLTLSDPARAAKLAVWGSYNALNQSPYEALCPARCGGETYRVKQKAFAVSSGIADGMVYYTKCLAAGDQFHCFRIDYKSEDKPIFDPVTSRIARSLR